MTPARGEVNDTPAAPARPRVAGAAATTSRPLRRSSCANTSFMSAGGTKLKPVDKIWLDGKLVPFAQAQVHILTHTLHYGVGAFEGIRAYKRADGTTRDLPPARAHRAAVRHVQASCMIDVAVHARAGDGSVRRDAARQQDDRGATSARSCSSATARWASTRRTTRCAPRSSRGQWGAYLGDEALREAASAPRSARSRAAPHQRRPSRRAR